MRSGDWMCAATHASRVHPLTPFNPVPWPQLMPETLFLTVNLIDRFLAEKQVTRKNLQLVRSCRAW